MIIVLYPTQYDSPDKRGRGCQLLINSSEQKRVLLNKEEEEDLIIWFAIKQSLELPPKSLTLCTV